MICCNLSFVIYYYQFISYSCLYSTICIHFLCEWSNITCLVICERYHSSTMIFRYYQRAVIGNHKWTRFKYTNTHILPQWLIITLDTISSQSISASFSCGSKRKSRCFKEIISDNSIWLLWWNYAFVCIHIQKSNLDAHLW